MDQATKDRIRHEVEQNKALFPGAVRRVEWQSHSDDPHFEPGELLPSLVLTEALGRRIGRPEPAAAFRKFQRAHGPAVAEGVAAGLSAVAHGTGASMTPARSAHALNNVGACYWQLGDTRQGRLMLEELRPRPWLRASCFTPAAVHSTSCSISSDGLLARRG